MSEFDNSSTGSDNSGNLSNTVDPMQAIKGPSVFLLIAGILNAVTSFINIAVNALGTTLSLLEESAADTFIGGGIGILGGIIGVVVSALIIFASLKMKKLENYNLAMTASIIVMIPILSSCCLIGLPAGIWSLVVLRKPEVKSAFLS